MNNGSPSRDGLFWLNEAWATLPKCTGHFCGRIGNRTECTACPWGTRIMDDIEPLGPASQCEPCLSAPDFHGWLYLSFVAVLPIMLFFLLPSTSRTDRCSTTAHRTRPLPKEIQLIASQPGASIPVVQTITTPVETTTTDFSGHCAKNGFILPLSCCVIHTVTALISLLLFPPFGSLNVYTCTPLGLDEFYAVLVAAPGCASELVFPFISLPLAYYGLSALACLFIYSILLYCMPREGMWQPVAYHALYTYPILCLVICGLGGLLYFSFPYVLLLLAVVHSVYRFPILFDYCVQPPDGTLLPLCNPLMLCRALVTDASRYLPSLLISVFCYAYGLIAFTHSLSAWIVLLAPTPFLFYAITLPLTHPFVAFDGDYAFSLATTRCPPDRSFSQTAVYTRPTTTNAIGDSNEQQQQLEVEIQPMI